jgi:hypothetical protein
MAWMPALSSSTTRGARCAARALAKLKLGRIAQYLGNHWRYAVPHLLIYSLPAGMPAVIGVYVFALQKRKAQNWHGCHFWAAQGIERKYFYPQGKRLQR